MIAPSNVYVDWFRARQAHEPGSQPVVAEGESVHHSFDPDQANDKVTMWWCNRRGSHSSGFAVRSDGTFVEVDGNPSRWGRLDNVIGLGQHAAYSVVNMILDLDGCSPFSAAEMEAADRQLQGRSHSGIERAAIGSDGCQIMRIDLCTNLVAGSATSASNAVSWFAEQFVHGKQGQLIGTRGKGLTALWKTRRYTIRIYEKGPELTKHTPRGLPREDLEYRQKLAKFCTDSGIIRVEVELRSDACRRAGIQTLDGYLNANMADVLMEHMPHVPDAIVSYSDIADTLISDGVSPQQAHRTEEIVRAWAAGHDPRQSLRSSRTFYRYADYARRCGYDIRSRMRDTVVRLPMRHVALEPFQAPSWYRHAA